MKKTEDIFAEFMENCNVEDSAAVQQSDERALRYFYMLTGKDKTELEDILSYAGYEHEKQGFMNGFAYALSLEKGGAMA